MKKLDCKVAIKDLMKKDVVLPLTGPTPEVLTVGRALALMLQNKGQTKVFANNHLKIFEMEQKLFDLEDVELDTSDIVELKKVVQESTMFNSTVLGQIQKALILLESNE